MVHPKISGYDVLDVTRGEGNRHQDFFVGMIDGELHLLGWRPPEARAYFTENECSSLDLGRVKLPDGKKSLKELVEGDIILVEEEGIEPYSVAYHGML